MADTAAAPAPAKTSAKKAPKAKKVAKAPAAHPKYSDMIAAAISSLKDRKGSSAQAIKKYIIANYKVDEDKVSARVRVALRRGVTIGALKQVKGTGASGSFKVAEKEKAAAKPKKAAAKSPKKAAAKKPVAKKAAKSPKKAAKKTSAKKSPKKSTKKAAKPTGTAKKPAAKKTKKVAAKK